MTDFSGLVVFKNPGNGEHGLCTAEAARDGDGCTADYFRNRERAERAAAKRAQSIAARQVHQELAQHYAKLASRAE